MKGLFGELALSKERKGIRLKVSPQADQMVTSRVGNPYRWDVGAEDEWSLMEWLVWDKVWDTMKGAGNENRTHRDGSE